jgi:hypothetical protein
MKLSYKFTIKGIEALMLTIVPDRWVCHFPGVYSTPPHGYNIASFSNLSNAFSSSPEVLIRETVLIELGMQLAPLKRTTGARLDMHLILGSQSCPLTKAERKSFLGYKGRRIE